MRILYCFLWISQLTLVSAQPANRRACPPPPDFLFGNLNPGRHRIGSVRTYSCSPGYQPMGDPTIKCRNDLTWTPLQLACLGCPEPAAKFGCGNITAGASTLHTTRVYRCRTGSEPANPVTTTCLPGPQGPTWSEPTHICSGCASASVTQNGSTYPPTGPVIAFLCDSGLVALGICEISCVDSNGDIIWTKPVTGCSQAVPKVGSVDYCKRSPCLNGGKCSSTMAGFKCLCIAGYSGIVCEGLQSDCKELLSSGIGNVTGVYTIQPTGSEKFQVVCDMDTDGGGWTVIQSRPVVENTKFNKLWKDYEKGFGTIDLAGSFWLGLENIHLLTKGGASELRIDFQKNNAVKAAAIYQGFSVAEKSTGYTLKLGAYSFDRTSGFVDPGDSFSSHSGAKFSTPDVANAGFNSHGGFHGCGKNFNGGWWYIKTYCVKADLNGVTAWHTFNGYKALSKTNMMIRRK